MRRNVTNAQRQEQSGRGPVGKVAVVGAKNRATKQIAARVVQCTAKETLQGLLKDHVAKDATVYTDDAKAYRSLSFNHAAG